MTIEITNPELEAFSCEASAPDFRTGADLINSLQECPYPEVEIESERIPSPAVRDVTI